MMDSARLRDPSAKPGDDTGTPVNDEDYQVPFKFTGKIDKLMISVERSRLTAADEQRLLQAERSASDNP